MRRARSILIVLSVCSVGCATKPAVTTTSRAPGPAPAAEVEVVVVETPEFATPTAAPALLAPRREDWAFAENPGHVIHTPHFRIYTTIEYERILDRLPVFMEAALGQYVTALGPLPMPPSTIETFVFQDRRQWTAKTRQMLPEQVSDFQNLGRGGYTTQGTSVLYYIDWAGRDRDTLAIAAHEGWHQYTQTTFRQPLPIWLEEGIATLMEGYRYRRSDESPVFLSARNRERGRALGDAMRRRQLIPLEQLLNDAPQAFLKSGKNQLLVYYAQVWALTRFLEEGANGRYRAALTEVLVDAADGRLAQRLARSPAILARGARGQALADRAGPWVIYAYFNDNLDEFEQEYLAYARTIAR